MDRPLLSGKRRHKGRIKATEKVINHENKEEDNLCGIIIPDIRTLGH